MTEFLENIDRSLLLFYNDLHTPFMDSFMWFMSEKYVWIPFYAFIIFLYVRKVKLHSLIWILLTLVTFTLTDFISVNVIKEGFARYRPTQNLDIHHMIKIVNNYRGGLYGFVSAHAANTFGLATISHLLLNKKWYAWVIFIWAAVVSFSRIYLGVHYPSDVAGGALLGVITGFVVWGVYKIIMKRREKAKYS